MQLPQEMPVINSFGDHVSAETGILFPIRFIFNGEAYRGQVLRKETTAMEYHVHDIQPFRQHMPDPFIVASNLRRDLFDFPVNETFYPAGFGKAIVAAIETACQEMDLPLFTSDQRQAPTEMR